MIARRTQLFLAATLGGVLSTFFVPISAQAQTLPPCCTTPPIVQELSQRPSGETIPQLFDWLEVRQRQRSRTELNSDLAALEGACATGCATMTQIALNRLRAIVDERDFAERHEPDILPNPIRIVPVRNPGQPGVPASQRQPTAPILATSGPQFRNVIIRQLIAWPREPDEVPAWLDRQLQGLSVEQLTHLQEALGGWCTPERACPAAMVIGRLTVSRRIAEQAHADELSRADQARAEEANFRRWDWLATIVSGLMGALAGLAAALITIVFGQRYAKRQAAALEQTVSHLDRTLKQLERAPIRYSTNGRAKPRRLS